MLKVILHICKKILNILSTCYILYNLNIFMDKLCTYLAKTGKGIYYKNHVLYIDNSDEKSRFYEYEKKMNERERRNHIFREKKWMLRFHISCSFPISNSPNKKSQSAGFSFFLMRTHSEFVVYTYGLKLGEKILQIVMNIKNIW